MDEGPNLATDSLTDLNVCNSDRSEMHRFISKMDFRQKRLSTVLQAHFMIQWKRPRAPPLTVPL